jgi:hypothetical protein
MNTKSNIRILMVDDQDPPAREVCNELQDLPDECEFNFEFQHVTDLKGYHRIISQNTEPFDVLIADLKLTMEQHDLIMGVEQTVSWHLLHSPSTIVIVYSVFTSFGEDELSNAIDACVLAMKAGATACIRKSTHSTRKLIETILSELRLRSDPMRVFENSWWADHSELLLKKYSGKAIAIAGDLVIATADTIPALREVLRSMDGEQKRGISPRLLLVPENVSELEML